MPLPLPEDIPFLSAPPLPLQMFAAGGKKGKGADKEGASRFKKDIITYKNQALQPVRGYCGLSLVRWVYIRADKVGLFSVDDFWFCRFKFAYSLARPSHTSGIYGFTPGRFCRVYTHRVGVPRQRQDRRPCACRKKINTNARKCFRKTA